MPHTISLPAHHTAHIGIRAPAPAQSRTLESALPRPVQLAQPLRRSTSHALRAYLHAAAPRNFPIRASMFAPALSRQCKSIARAACSRIAAYSLTAACARAAPACLAPPHSIEYATYDAKKRAPLRRIGFYRAMFLIQQSFSSLLCPHAYGTNFSLCRMLAPRILTVLRHSAPQSHVRPLAPAFL